MLLVCCGPLGAVNTEPIEIDAGALTTVACTGMPEAQPEPVLPYSSTSNKWFTNKTTLWHEARMRGEDLIVRPHQC
jgi:hypothetical protein